MKCSEIRRAISRELDGELERSRVEDLEKHLETCDECRGYRASMQRIYSLHSRLAEAEPPSRLHGNVMSSIEEPAGRVRSNLWFRFAVPAAAALVMFLGFLAGERIAEMVGPENGNGQNDVFGLEYLEELPPGSIGELMLADSDGGESDER